MGGVIANPHAEVTVRVHYKPLVSPGAALFQLFAPPLPRSAYVFGNAIGDADNGLTGVEQLMKQQHEFCEESLTEGPAPLPLAMVGTMMPPAPGEAVKAKAGVKGVKANLVRVAAALDPFAAELKALGAALSWENPVYSGLLHVAVVTAVFHSWTVFPALTMWLAVHTMYAVKPGRWTLLGADKSDQSGSFDVGRAPPGSKLLGAELATLLGPDAPSELDHLSVSGGAGAGAGGKTNKGLKTAGRALGVSPSVDTYEGCVQTIYWVQTLLRHAVRIFEGLHDLVTWKDAAKSNAFMVSCFVGAWATLAFKFQWILLACCFVALRHPVAAKPATLPYRLGLASD